MSKEIRTVLSVTDIADGAVDDLVKHELPKIMDNMGDENTKWNVERGMDVKIRFRMTDESRETAIVSVEVVPKLANVKPHESTMHMEFDGKHVQGITLSDSVQPELDENIADFPAEEAK